jgi:hypothetical protein
MSLQDKTLPMLDCRVENVVGRKPLAFAADAGELWVLLGRFEDPSPLGMPK